MAVTVELEALERRIAELVANRRPVLEQLVRDAVDRELVALVDRELDLALQRLASRDDARVAEPDVDHGLQPNEPERPAAREPCSRCGAEPRLKGRTIGVRCKRDADLVYRARQRERKAPAADDDDGPREPEHACSASGS